jgi:hypothetical protein
MFWEELRVGYTLKHGLGGRYAASLTRLLVEKAVILGLSGPFAPQKIICDVSGSERPLNDADRPRHRTSW